MLLNRPAGIGGQNRAIDVDRVVAEQERDRCGQMLRRCHRRNQVQERAETSSAVLGDRWWHRDASRAPPGAMAFTRMLCGPYMQAVLRVKPTMPCLETV
jgi:hypothetical protein